MRVSGFDRDDGNWPKCGKHGVSREEIESVSALDPTVEADRSHSGAEHRLKGIGPSLHGRFVFIVFTLRQRDGETFIRPISARYMNGKEVRHYERS